MKIEWKGQLLEFEEDDLFTPCKDGEHNVGVMHHYGEDGKHYCPTQLLYCYRCFVMAEEPEPYVCHLWGEGGW